MKTRLLALLAGAVAAAVLVSVALSPALPGRAPSVGATNPREPHREATAVSSAQRRSTATAMAGPGESIAVRAENARTNGAREASAGSGGGLLIEPPTVAVDAAQSLADALRHGDERSPPIAPDDPTAERASPAELVDPAAYRRYEQRQQARLYRAFEQEAVIALNDLQRDLQRGRAAALPPEQIAEGEEKQRRLAETLERLRQGELGAQQ